MKDTEKYDRKESIEGTIEIERKIKERNGQKCG